MSYICTSKIFLKKYGMNEKEFLFKVNKVITPMDITTIAEMIIEFDKVEYNRDTFIKKITSRIYGVKLDEVTIEQIKSVIIMCSLYLSSHIINSLRVYPN